THELAGRVDPDGPGPTAFGGVHPVGEVPELLIDVSGQRVGPDLVEVLLLPRPLPALLVSGTARRDQSGLQRGPVVARVGGDPADVTAIGVEPFDLQRRRGVTQLDQGRAGYAA